MKDLKIYVQRDLDGFTFSLPMEEREYLIKEFNAEPSKGIYISYDTKVSFEDIHGKVENHIYPMLLGVKEEDIKNIGNIVFMDTNHKVLKKLIPSEEDYV